MRDGWAKLNNVGTAFLIEDDRFMKTIYVNIVFR